MKNLKHIPLKHAYNVRDLGGYPTVDGRSTKWGILYRSDALNSLEEEDWKILQERNIRTILDLRSSSETKGAPIHVPGGMEYRQFSLMSQLDRSVDPRSMSREAILESMKLDYVKTLFGNVSCCAEIFQAMLSGMERGAVLFLCSAGKDRTGIVAAVALYLCRVVREDIIADYVVSSTYNTNGINRKMMNLPEEMKKMIPDMELLKECFDSKPETVIQLLDALESRDIRSVLDENGFTEAQQETFREWVTEV